MDVSGISMSFTGSTDWRNVKSGPFNAQVAARLMTVGSTPSSRVPKNGEEDAAMTGDEPGKAGGLRSFFGRIAGRAADIAGGPWAFLIAAFVVAAWAAVGPIFDF